MNCSLLSQKLQILHSLEEEFSTVSKKAEASRDFTKARELKAQMEQEMQELESLLGFPEILGLNIEKTIETNKLFYESYGINLPSDFKEKTKEIWIKNRDAIEKEIKTMGYDRAIIIPNTLPDTASLHTKMTEEYNPTYEGQNFKDGGSFQGSTTPDEGFCILLLHNAQEIDENPHLLSTKGKSIDELQTTFPTFTGLSLPEYLLFQKMYNEETGNHLDTRLFIWLPKTKSGSRVVSAFWYPGSGLLYVGANDSGNRNVSRGCRLSRSFK
jgi:hypothetical protein